MLTDTYFNELVKIIESNHKQYETKTNDHIQITIKKQRPTKYDIKTKPSTITGLGDEFEEILNVSVDNHTTIIGDFNKRNKYLIYDMDKEYKCLEGTYTSMDHVQHALDELTKKHFRKNKSSFSIRHFYVRIDNCEIGIGGGRATKIGKIKIIE